MFASINILSALFHASPLIIHELKSIFHRMLHIKIIYCTTSSSPFISVKRCQTIRSRAVCLTNEVIHTINITEINPIFLRVFDTIFQMPKTIRVHKTKIIQKYRSCYVVIALYLCEYGIFFSIIVQFTVPNKIRPLISCVHFHILLKI